MIDSVSDDLESRLEEIQARHDRVSAEMSEPGVAADQVDAVASFLLESAPT